MIKLKLFDTPRSSIYKVLDSFKKSVSKKKGIYKPDDLKRFVFLCGGNINENKVSARRTAIKGFADKYLTNAHFFYAEKLFDELRGYEHKGNLLDIEHEISDLSDIILIILESPSAFCELGAFSDITLRDKLIVINDSKYINTKSFINHGPLLAIKEQPNGASRIISYNMSEDGKHSTDAIGDTFKLLHDILKRRDSSQSAASYIDFILCDPKEHFDKNSIRFIHDLVYLTGPIRRAELIDILLMLFGKGDYKRVTHHLGMLVALGLICTMENNIFYEKNKLYKSKLHKTYFSYDFDINNIISTFKNIYFRYSPNRFREN